MRVPLPFEVDGVVVRDVEFTRPRGGVIADVQKQASQGDVYSAMALFIAGSLTEVTGDGGITAPMKQVAKAMPWQTANWAAVQILLQLGVGDEIDQLWTCPRCGHRFGTDPDDPVTISNLEIAYADEAERVGAELSYPVEFKDTRSGEVVQAVNSLTLRHATLEDCSKARKSVGQSDPMRLQYAIYANAIEEVNGESVSKKWRAEWGAQTFERMDIADLQDIGGERDKYGYQQTVMVRCPSCDKRFEGIVNLSSFFASGLRGQA